MESGKRQMAQVCISLADEISARYRDRGLLVRLVDDEVEHCIHMLVRADRGRAGNNPVVTELGFEWAEARWHGSWYARLLRWVHKRWPRLFWRLPEVLKFIGDGRIPNHVYKQWTLPDDVLDRVVFQANYLARVGSEPTKVVLGRQAHVSIRDASEGGYYGSLRAWLSGVFGLEVTVSDWLEPDAVVVI